MTNETLKISLAQRILSINNNAILEKINNLLNEDIVGYEVDGKPITQEKFISEMKKMDSEIENGTFEEFSSDEVRNFILGK